MVSGDRFVCGSVEYWPCVRGGIGSDNSGTEILGVPVAMNTSSLI